MTRAAAVRPAAEEHPPYFSRYIDLVEGTDVVAALERELETTLALVAGISEEGSTYRYAPEKWSIREVIGHLADAERIFGYRALRIARGDTTPLSGFDENAFVPASAHHEVPVAELADELTHLRRSHVSMFRHLPASAWSNVGTSNGTPITARAIAFIMAGHDKHHRSILETRYVAG